MYSRKSQKAERGVVPIMRPSTRLKLISLMFLISAGYGALIAQDSGIATAFALGYVAILLTIFVFCEVFKKDE
jgi:hypothetical protein